jgi:diguanylate cyclase (GGDEF)-like protein
MPGTLSRAASVIATVAGLFLLRSLVLSTRSNEARLDATQAEEAKRAELTDEPTGLGNQRCFERELERTVKQAQRHGNTVTLSLVDVDSYERIVAEYGQSVGHRMMAELGTFLGGRRADDRTFRLEGGRFAIILPYTTAREIWPLMEHRRSETEQSELGTTVTIGAADIGPRMDATSLLQRATAALAEARLAGGNRVATLEPETFEAEPAAVAALA